MASTSTIEEPIGSAVESSPSSMAIEAKLTLDCQNLKDLLSKDSTTVSMDAKLLVSAGHDECQMLKNLLNKKELAVMMVATVVKKNDRQVVSEAKPPTSKQLRLLAAASEGDLEELKYLLDSGSAGGGASGTGDVEKGNIVPAPSTSVASLMESVTPLGDTALHLMAASGGGEDYMRCVEFIDQREKRLLYKPNSKGDTPMHSAARAGKSRLVYYLIDLARRDGKLQLLLRMSNNNNETALHEAIRRGDKEIVDVLLRADPELACFPKDGTSPLYLTIQMIDDRAILRKEDRQAMRNGRHLHFASYRKKSMVQLLRDESKGLLSYLGPHGQNALHAAVLRGPELTRKLLRWNKDLKKQNEDLTEQKDENGSTPLHFAAGLYGAHRKGSVCSQVLDANPDALFQRDNKGLYPIHVAASVGAIQAVTLFIKKHPRSACLRDAKWGTFLHVAIENKQVTAVYIACMNRSLPAWIMNMQDNDGNTALHLAIKAGSLRMFCALCGNQNVHLNITNAKGETPLDIAKYKVPPVLFYDQNSEGLIYLALNITGARNGASRRDHSQEKYQDIHGMKSEYESQELEKMKDLSASRSIAAVLIATVAFGAAFALPGGYKADDHANGGTPTLAGRYAFDGFLMANTLAFVFSTAAVACIARGGSPTYNRNSRIIYLGISFHFMELSITCFVAAFALGAFVVLSPVARKTTIAICATTPLILLFNRAEFLLKRLLLVPSFWVRKGSLWASGFFISAVFVNMFQHFWPFLLIFIWATYGRTHPISEVEPPAHPPSA